MYLKISLLAIAILVIFTYLWFKPKKEKKKLVKINSKPIYFKEVYSFYKENGYLSICKKDKYKFSAPRLQKIINKSYSLQTMDINNIQEAIKIPDIGVKVFDLIQHLTIKYKSEII